MAGRITLGLAASAVAVTLTMGGIALGLADSSGGRADRWGAAVAGAAPEAEAAPEAAGAAAARGASQQIALIEDFTGGEEALVDVAGAEETEDPGDYNVFRDPLLDPADRRRLGQIHVTCLRSFQGVDLCRGTVFLAGRGKITFDGTVPPAFDPAVGFALSVTGGIGDFLDAGGAVRVSFPSEDAALLRLRLT